MERTARSIRLRDTADAELVRRAKAAGMSVNAYLEVLMLGTPEPKVAEPPPNALVGTICPHPRESRKVFAWGSKCDACGERVH